MIRHCEYSDGWLATTYGRRTIGTLCGHRPTVAQDLPRGHHPRLLGCAPSLTHGDGGGDGDADGDGCRRQRVAFCVFLRLGHIAGEV